MIMVNIIQWNLYIVKWQTGQFTIQVSPEVPEAIDWIDLLDSEGDPDSAEVRRISPSTKQWLGFEQIGLEECFRPHILPEHATLSDMFDSSSDVVWPD
jgi:hypothetical protein